MSQYVIEFGAKRVDTIAAAIALCLASPMSISVDDEAHPFHDVETERPLTGVVTDLESGIVASAVIRCTDERIRYAHISSPLFNKEGLSKWMGTIELGVETWSFVWDALLGNPGLLFVCVGHEEGVELRDEQLSVDSFPWSEWPLLIGAVRPTQGSEWVIRRRPAKV
jgi:hypothetical protein